MALHTIQGLSTGKDSSVSVKLRWIALLSWSYENIRVQASLLSIVHQNLVSRGVFVLEHLPLLLPAEHCVERPGVHRAIAGLRHLSQGGLVGPRQERLEEGQNERSSLLAKEVRT